MIASLKKFTLHRSQLFPSILVQEPLIIVTHAHHPLASMDTVELSELEQLANPFFHIDWSFEVKRWQSKLVTTSGTEVEVPPQTAHDLLLRGIGAALLTRTLVANDLAAGRLVEIPVWGLPLLLRESVLVRLSREEKLPAAVNEFIRVFREEARAYSKTSRER